MKLGKFSMGIGDRFAHQGKAQLTALQKAEKEGIVIIPVWNKSFREHQIIHSQPSGTRLEADEAVIALNWKHPYFVDADHIGVKSVDHFIDSADFFTLDVADFIGKSAQKESIEAFSSKCSKYLGDLNIPGISESFHITKETIESIAGKYLFAAEEAGRIYRHILEKKGEGNFVVEVSMDETDAAQTPIELFFILAAI
ncbi:MAG: tagaturonate epimerase family protein, partial [Syntrophothermus sp.]